eukprot:jgi/Bigna1/146342/aug1.112_g21050
MPQRGALTYELAPGSKVILNVHGGGHVIGGLAQESRVMEEFALDLDLIVMNVDYRKLPEVSPIVQVLDVASAYAYLLSNGVRPSDISMHGCSAGSNIIVSLLSHLRQSQSPLPQAVVLESLMMPGGGYKDFREYPDFRERGGQDVLSAEAMIQMQKWQGRWGAGHAGGVNSFFKLSALPANSLVDLPPILLLSSENEIGLPSVKENVAYLKRMSGGGRNRISSRSFTCLYHCPVVGIGKTQPLLFGVPEASLVYKATISWLQEHTRPE